MSSNHNSYPWNAPRSLSVLVGLTDLSSIFGVKSPSVVANWRTRSLDFPAPKVSRPVLYDLMEVALWLAAEPRRQQSTQPLNSAEWYRRVVKAFHDGAHLENPKATAVALVLLHHLAVDRNIADGRRQWNLLILELRGRAGLEGGSLDGQLLQLVQRLAGQIERELPHLSGALVEPLAVSPSAAGAVLDLADALDVVDGRGDDGASAAVLNARRRLNEVFAQEPESRGRESTATERYLAKLLAALAAPRAGETVLDPAAGEATVLVSCYRQSNDRAVLLGQEVSAAQRHIARAVLEVRSIEADLGANVCDTLTFDQHPHPVDVVVIDPPCSDVDPPLDAWMHYGLRHLRPEGRLVMVVPAVALVNLEAVRRRPDEGARRFVEQMAREGRLDLALVLPRNLRPDVVGPLVVLRIAGTPAERPNDVTLAAIHSEHRANSVEIIRRLASAISRIGSDSSDAVAWIQSGGTQPLANKMSLDGASADEFMWSLERMAREIDRLSSRRGAQRKASTLEPEDDDPTSSWMGRVTVVPSSAPAYSPAPSFRSSLQRSTTPVALEISDALRKDPVDRVDHSELVDAVRALLAEIQANDDLMSEKLKRQLRPSLERIRKHL